MKQLVSGIVLAAAVVAAPGCGRSQFFLSYNAYSTGQIVSVGRWENDGDLTHLTGTVAFDAQGHRIPDPPEAEDEDP